MLGREYAEKLRIEQSKWDELLEVIDVTLSNQSQEALATGFGITGLAQTDPFIRYQQAWMERAMEFLELDHLIMCGLGLPSLQPDYDYWANVAFYDVNEVTYLSLGIEPAFDVISKITGPKIRPEPILSASREILKRGELLMRELTQRGQTNQIDHDWLVNWYSKIDLNLHPKFDALLLRIADKQTRREVPSDGSPTKDTPHRSEIESMAKLVAAISISEFGYDPTAKRSPIPNEIVGITERLGLNLSSDTVRKYLQMGAKHLPNGWNAD